MIASPLEESLINKIRWFLGDKLYLKNFSIFFSLGVREIFKPEINREMTDKAKEKFLIFKDKILKKKDILDIKINNVELGDLIYDTYLKFKKKPTILIDKDFYTF